jgi:hypothetical protein
MFVGSSVATIQTLAKGDPETDLFYDDVLSTVVAGTIIVLDLTQGSIWGGYEHALQKAGIEQLALGPGPTPFGVSLVGRF